MTAQQLAIHTRRIKLHQSRTEAIARGDWAAMNEITKRIAKLPTPKGQR